MKRKHRPGFFIEIASGVIVSQEAIDNGNRIIREEAAAKEAADRRARRKNAHKHGGEVNPRNKKRD